MPLAGHVPAADTLSFAATVDPALLHRRNPAEVFLTDLSAAGPRRAEDGGVEGGEDGAEDGDDAGGGFAAAALLPAGHPHYGSLAGPAGDRVDPMLLLECCRQAETYAAHALHGVAEGVGFIFRGLSVETFPDPERAAGHAAPDAATRDGAAEPRDRLVMACRTREPGVRRGAVSSLDYDFDLWTGRRRTARIVLRVGYAEARTYAALRSRRRGGPPPTSDAPVTAPAGVPVEPVRAGRLRATDCLLLDLAAGPAEVTAGLRVPVENPSYFDHPHDHVPGMVLVEAARQLAVAAAGHWDGAPGGPAAMTAVEAEFSQYAELDRPTALSATALDGPGAGPRGRHVEVVLRQDATEVARMRVTTRAADARSGAAEVTR
ncbi:AfsA-related hotdog domain-containing protein [Streptomyces sp. V4-01]|uniref:AfsA-related hotdog domain-containing protein n=1 Tax=Actinacidiphila polyblastidii TaxID=3110430 RepID=A0ABU7P9M1_9ACTN|nr:AfsA-related hotdog domain-containing protein [Streptomyces sp. V4-01]